MHYIYILRCNDKTLYTGYTTDISRRLQEHNQGTASKYTRSRLPAELVYYETYDSKSDALKREAEIKQMPKKQKEALICGYA